MTDTQIAYVAGIFDGEGCIFIHEKNPRKRGKSTNFELEIYVVNTNMPMLQFVQRVCGGNISKNGLRIHLRDGRLGRQSWRWAAQSRKAADLLRQLLPYLIVKYDQAVLALQFAETKVNRQGRGRLKVEDLELRRSLAEQIKALKRV